MGSTTGGPRGLLPVVGAAGGAVRHATGLRWHVDLHCTDEVTDSDDYDRARPRLA